VSLYTRLLGQGNGIDLHAFQAALGEWERGFMTSQQVVAMFALDAGEQTEALTLVGKLVYPRDSVTMSCIPAGHTLTNIGTAYDGTGGLALGYALMQANGITQVIFGVRVNKVGGGTQSWQLWNETDAQEVCVINDAGATGLKSLSVTQNFAQALGPGIKTLRVRAKSTTAADDPVFFSAMFSVRRGSNMTAVELHEVLLLAANPSSPLHNEASLKARLGIA